MGRTSAMIGMKCGSRWQSSNDEDFFESRHYAQAPTSTICQLSLTEYAAYDDDARVMLGFVGVLSLGPQGQTVPRNFDFVTDGSGGNVPFLAVTNMTEVSWVCQLHHCSANYLINLFYWNSVSGASQGR